MTTGDADLLIHRHLEGALSEPEAAALEARLKADPAFRRRLAEMAFDRAQMREVLSAPAAGAVPAMPAAPRVSKRALLPMAAAAIIVASVGTSVAIWSFRDRPVETGVAQPAQAPTAADPFRGFAGPVRGRVLGRSETALRLEVLSVPGRPGEHPLVGRVVFVMAGSTKSEGGEVGPDRTHQGFLKKLEEGVEETLDLRHQRDDLFAIGELTEAQEDWANRRAEKRRPDGDREDPLKRSPDRGRRETKDAPREGPRDGDREGAPREERPREGRKD